MTASQALIGWRVLVPRGGVWGEGVASALRHHGATPVIAPMIEFRPPREEGPLVQALATLEAGGFAWLVVTSATTVAELARRRVTVPPGTRIAAVGETTAARMVQAGYRVDFVPTNDHSARGLVAHWPRSSGALVQTVSAGDRVLLPQSDLAAPLLADGLRSLGFEVHTVTAYHNVAVPVAQKTVADVRAGRFDALLVTSGSIARQIRDQFGTIPRDTCIACIGDVTALDAQAAGLSVDVIARTRTASSLVDTLADFVRARASGAEHRAQP